MLINLTPLQGYMGAEGITHVNYKKIVGLRFEGGRYETIIMLEGCDNITIYKKTQNEIAEFINNAIKGEQEND